MQLLFPTLTHAMHTKMKLNKLIRLSLFSSLLAFVACNGTETTTEELSSDAEITSFYLAEDDSVATDLSTVFFTIDQTENKIYNADSLPVGTDLSTKLLANISFASASKATIYYSATDSASYSSTDSINFANPFLIKVVAYDGVTSKTYEVKLNVHQQEPDSLNWMMLTDAAWDFSYNSSKTVALNNKFLTYFNTGSSYLLYSSPVGNGVQWNSETLSNFPPNAMVNSITAFNEALFVVTADQKLYKSTDGLSWSLATSETGFVALLGSIKDKDGISRFMVSRIDGGKYYIEYSTDGATFTNKYLDITASAEQEVFPVSDFAVITSPGLKSNKLTVVGGVDGNGQTLPYLYQMYWDKYNSLQYAANISNYYSHALESFRGFSARKGAIAFYYDDKMVVAAGQGSNYNRDLYASEDNGVTWQKQDSLINLPQSFTPRANASVYIDNDKFVWIFGGNYLGNPLNEIWRGRINRLGFK